VSFDKLRTRVGFSCEKTLEDGIQEVYDLVRSGKIPDIKAEQYHNHALVAAFMPGPDAERLSLTMLETLARNE
jgi:hypothetical protein